MDRTGSRTFLRVISVTDVALGVLAVVAGVCALMGEGLLGIATGPAGASGAIAAEITIADTSFSLLGLTAGLLGIYSIIEGSLGLQAASDPSKVRVAWAFTLVGLALSLANLVFNIVHQGDVLSVVLDLICSMALIWVLDHLRSATA